MFKLLFSLYILAMSMLTSFTAVRSTISNQLHPLDSLAVLLPPPPLLQLAFGDVALEPQHDDTQVCCGAHPSFLKASSVMKVLPQPLGPHTPSITGTRTPPSESARKFFTMCICGTARKDRSQAQLRLGTGSNLQLASG